MADQGYVHPALKSKTHSARIVLAERDTILGEWVKRVQQEVDTAGVLLRPIIIDTIPLYIERLAESLCEECRRETATESSSVAQEHGGERARVTKYGPEQVIQEYLILKEVIRAKILSITTLSEPEDLIIQKSFDKAIQEAMVAYFLVHGRLREQFVAALTHDLRNPINAAKLAGDLVLAAVADGPTPEAMTEIKELTERSLKSLRRAERMIQDMLDASVVQTGESLTINITAGDLDDIVKAATGDRPAKETARLVVQSKSIQGYWDLDGFQRSIENLINNAFKYGDPKTPVTVKVDESHDRVIVSVHNFGNPIPAEDQESLFQVFRRAEAAKAGRVKGWGIGLALARSTAEKMGGSLGLDSSAEQGTTFSIDVLRDTRAFQ